jgi:nucleoside-diphosphate-sugar epimerase
MTIPAMKILITGGTGFIGSHLAEHLSAKNAEVFALVRNPARLKFLKGQDVRHVQGDLFHVPALPPDLDVVYHLAGSTKALKSAHYYTVNHLGSASFFEALERQHVRAKIVYLSSLAACGPSERGRSRKESDPPTPVTPYGKSKLLGEQEALSRKDRFPVTIIRVGAVYGPRDTDFLKYFKYVRRGIIPSLGFKERALSLCYIKDLVRALELAALKDLESGDILNIADTIPYNMDSLGRAAGHILGKKPRRVIIPLPLVFGVCLVSDFINALARRPSIINRHKYREYLQPGWVADVTKAREKLAFETKYPLEEGLRETILWYLDNGWL